jgi:hypothetical protein
MRSSGYEPSGAEAKLIMLLAAKQTLAAGHTPDTAAQQA